MKTAFIFALGVTCATALQPAHCQTYQWKDSSGKTVISDAPPPGSAAKSARAIGGQQPAAVKEAAKTEEKPTDGPKTTAEKNLEFKKRQQENSEKAEKLAKEQKAEAEKRENCERFRRNLAALEANQPIATLNDKGERQIMDDTQRQQEMERARKLMSETCSN